MSTYPALREEVGVEEVEPNRREVLESRVADDWDHIGIHVVPVVHPGCRSKAGSNARVPLGEETGNSSRGTAHGATPFVGSDGTTERLRSLPLRREAGLGPDRPPACQGVCTDIEPVFPRTVRSTSHATGHADSRRA